VAGGQLLVEFGADIAAKNDEGDTPLLEALMEKRFEVGTLRRSRVDGALVYYSRHEADASTVLGTGRYC
jgi:ankyrin repeat protein